MTPRAMIPALLERLPFPVLRTGAQAATVLASRLGGAGATLFVTLLLTRNLDQDAVGIVLTALAAAVLGEVAATMGRDAVAVQVIPQALAGGDQARASAFARGLLSRTVVGAPLAGAAAGLALWPLTDGAAGLAVMATTALVVAGMTSLRVLSRLVMAAGGIAMGAIPLFVVRPALWLGGVAALAATGTLTTATALGAIAAAAFATSVLQVALGVRRLAFVAVPPTASEPIWARDGRQLIVPGLMIGELPNLVTLCASVLLAAPQIAVLGVALRIAGLVALGSRSLVAALGPRLSAAWTEADPSQAGRVARSIPTLAAPATLAVVVGVWALAPVILGVFGEGYAGGAWTLRVLVLMPLVTACAGPSLLVLTAAGRAGEGGKAAWPAVAALASLSLGGALGGTLGVALGVVAAIVLWEAMLIVRLERATGLSLWLPFGPRAR